MSPLSRGTTDPVHTASPADVRTGVLDIPEDPLGVGTDEARILSVSLFRRLNELTEGTAAYSYVRNTLVELNLSLVKYAARRFHHRSEPMEDIAQVGTIGLIKAINRYDVERGVEFATFALPTITGEMKRFFRDTSWAVKVPRRLQELRLDIAKAHDALEQRLGRRPTDHELAEHLGIDDDSVTEGRRAANGYSAGSFDRPAGEEPEGNPSPHTLGVEEPAYELIESLESLKPLLAGLGERDRLILSMRFGEDLTQAEIGDRLGVSQMQVSRLLCRIMTDLRTGLLSDDPPDPA
ncbi:SigB/SigF/SigG family RNA polymerase sigma factor [Streptomyces exfoliatus]|uniref:SigB/SigF/SigG family RNA polymerase sigma factor n=1 Tax=Streptomyces exfoliatus TaxID=1905 RepID=UPI000463160A|nr:SigB/SigF/SigG family RNA polymerase sigma factor [Streptomyces exfoliatus]